MLSDQEQRVWADMERHWSETAEEPVAVRRAVASMQRGARRERGESPGWVAGGVWISIFLILFGAVAAGLALAAVAGIGWALWPYWPELARAGRGTTPRR